MVSPEAEALMLLIDAAIDVYPFIEDDEARAKLGAAIMKCKDIVKGE